MLRNLKRAGSLARSSLRKFSTSTNIGKSNLEEQVDERKISHRDKLLPKSEPTELKNAMKKALAGLQANLNIQTELVKEKKPVVSSYGKVKKSNSGISKMALRARGDRRKREKLEEKNLKKVNLDELTTEEIIYSPMYQYSFDVKNELRKIQKKNKRKIEEFRVEETKRNTRKEVPEDKKYLTYKTFFEGVEKAKDSLKGTNPNLYRFYLRNGIFNSLDPRNFTPEDLQMPEYPGTLKGDRPEDDPEFYYMWMSENASPLMKKINELFSQTFSEEGDDKGAGMTHVEYGKRQVQASSTLTNMAVDDHSYMDYQNNTVELKQPLMKQSFIQNDGNVKNNFFIFF